MTEGFKRRAAFIIGGGSWRGLPLTYSATYPFGEISADRETLRLRVPLFKTCSFKRSEIQELAVFSGWSGVLRWLVMPGIRLRHTNPAEPSFIQIRVPDVQALRTDLERLGYHCSESGENPLKR
jgi:hypothetical protein